MAIRCQLCATWAFDIARAGLPEDIRDGTGTRQSIVFATPAELAEVRAEIFTLMGRFADRAEPANRPSDSLAFEMVAFTHVLEIVQTD